MNEKKIMCKRKKSRVHSVGFLFSLFSSALILLWLGIFKFTQVEAQAIYPLIDNHPLSSWIYGAFSVMTVSRMVGITEIGLALLLLLSLWKSSLLRYAALGIIAVFSFTLSFLFTTPGMWRITEYIPVTDFFIIKDLMFLGFGITFLEYSLSIHKNYRNE